MRLYNTLTKNIDFIQEDEIKIYCCGPTVYNYPHIGNWRTFVFVDALVSFLKTIGKKVKFVMNITDVDDKAIKGAKEKNIPFVKYVSFWENKFFEQSDLLGISPDIYCRATAHIEEMRIIIQKLLDKGIAYVAKEGIYFRVNKFKDYGKLSGKKPEQGVSRIEHDEYKENVCDFALWKFWKEEDGDVFWDIELEINGKKKVFRGRPGWHIECSAMSIKYLGMPLTIHCGGIDLIFPHHENEIAQSEGAFDKEFCKYWFHVNHLLINGEKMSKSLGNIIILNDIIEKGYSPKALRLLYLSSHYRTQQNFTWESLKSIQNFLETINKTYYLAKVLDENGNNYDNYIEKMKEHLLNDFQTNKAISEFSKFVEEVNKTKNYNGSLKVFKFFDSIFKVLDDREVILIKESKFIENPKTLKEKMILRNYYRANKNYELADKIREEIKPYVKEIFDFKDFSVYVL